MEQREVARRTSQRHGVGVTDYLVVLSTFNGSGAPWARHSPYPLLVLDKVNIPNIGFDASTYLWWIIRNYDILPDWCLFMHDHEYHWHHPFYSQLVSMAVDVRAMGHGYLNVAHGKDGMMQVYEKGALLELNVSENEQVAISLPHPSIPIKVDTAHLDSHHLSKKCGMLSSNPVLP